MKSTVGKTIAKSATRTIVSAPRSASGVAQPTVEFELPASFRAEQPAICRAVAVAEKNGYRRSFGPFAEKTLECNLAARQAIDEMCYEGGFTQAWAPGAATDGFMTMTKIPAIVLVKAMLGLPESASDAVASLTGAYGICMAPQQRTCMNVIVGRTPSDSGGYSLDKFSLYYPENAAVPPAWGATWNLLQGYSFRTAVLSGSLNRADLGGLRRGSIKTADATTFDRAKHGLIIDNESEFEDCAYVGVRVGESDTERISRIDQMVEEMAAAYGGTTGVLALSYDPAERAQGVTALESEWALLKKHVVAA
jgi:hypothetical protein